MPEGSCKHRLASRSPSANGPAPSTRNIPCGEVPEWSIGTVSKTVVPLRVPWVRIPPSPPFTAVCRPFSACRDGAVRKSFPPGAASSDIQPAAFSRGACACRSLSADRQRSKKRLILAARVRRLGKRPRSARRPRDVGRGPVRECRGRRHAIPKPISGHAVERVTVVDQVSTAGHVPGIPIMQLAVFP
jgi:hypothetical protein